MWNDVPGLVRQAWNKLYLMADSDQKWFAWLFCVPGTAASFQRTVIITTTHAEAVSGCVKSHQWHEDKVHLGGGQQLILGYCRFRDTVSVWQHYLARCPVREIEFILIFPVQYG